MAIASHDSHSLLFPPQPPLLPPCAPWLPDPRVVAVSLPSGNGAALQQRITAARGATPRARTYGVGTMGAGVGGGAPPPIRQIPIVTPPQAPKSPLERGGAGLTGRRCSGRARLKLCCRTRLLAMPYRLALTGPLRSQLQPTFTDSRHRTIDDDGQRLADERIPHSQHSRALLSSPILQPLVRPFQFHLPPSWSSAATSSTARATSSSLCVTFPSDTPRRSTTKLIWRGPLAAGFPFVPAPVAAPAVAPCALAAAASGVCACGAGSTCVRGHSDAERRARASRA